MSVSVMLVDDDQNILTSVSMLLESEGFIVYTYTDGAMALMALERTPCDIAILDVKMPRMTGTELLKNIRRRSVLPVIFLTSKDDESDQAQGLSLGADDYITKPFSQKLLLERIKAVLRRADPNLFPSNENDPAHKIYVRGALKLDPARHICEWKEQSVPVTVTEFLLLEALVKHPGHVKTRDALMNTAYSDDIYVDDRTIDSHIKRLRKKFRNVDSDFDAIQTLYGVGYKWCAE